MHALASRLTGRAIETINELTLEEARELYRTMAPKPPEPPTQALERSPAPPKPSTLTQPQTVEEWIAQARKNENWRMLEFWCDEKDVYIIDAIRACYPNQLPATVEDAIVTN
ncbi:MAG: hypothetical protein KatS3mg038_2770 [Candidatus Kapaibacterium sp.]|nr:MAG: hypothetical protein KatS3mg038_2770 [Candidatus Kapabacteria bacterium]